jgi:hypothetical protein
VVGFNLPFDLSRLALSWADARTHFAGGFSFVLDAYIDEYGDPKENRYRPRWGCKTIDSKRHLMGWTSPRGEQQRGGWRRGHFLDVKTLGFAHRNRSHSLASLCEALRVEHPKLAIAEHGPSQTGCFLISIGERQPIGTRRSVRGLVSLPTRCRRC